MLQDSIFTKVREGLTGHLNAILPTLLPGGRIRGREYVCGSMSGGPGDSCSTNLETGVGADFNAGEKWGDVIDLASQVWRVKPKEAAERLAEQYGLVSGNYAALSGQNRKTSQKRKQDGVVISIPADTLAIAPKMPKAHPRLGLPVACWMYRDANGKPLHYVMRFETADKDGRTGKEIVPLCLCRLPDKTLQWRWRAWPAPRPLYNLSGLAKAGEDAPILLVEGEKAADAAAKLFPDYVCMTWSGGCQAVHNADFTPLRDRKVIIWPDNDEGGFKAAHAIAGMLGELGVNIRILPLPDTLPEKWDVADTPPAGFDPQAFLAGCIESEQQSHCPVAPLPHCSVSSLPDCSVAPLPDCPVASLPSCPDSNDPEDDFIRPWPVLSPYALPDFVGKFIELATRSSEADPAAVLATFLVRFGAEVYGFAPKKGPYIRIGETVHPPRLYAAIAGASSKARKGTSAKPVLRLFETNPHKSKDAVPSAPHTGGPLSSGEGLAYRLRERNEDGESEPEDSAATCATSQDKRLFILDEELAAAISCFKREGNTLSMAVRSLWDSGSYEPLTKTAQISVRGAHVCIVTHITIQEVQSKLDSMQIANGFANRFLWICARRMKLVPCPEAMPQAEFKALHSEFWKLVRQAQNRSELQLTPEAKAYWTSFYPELSQDTPGVGGDIIARGEAQCVRLALIYALLDGKDSIDIKHLLSALTFWQYAKDSALYIFGSMEEEGLAKKILTFLRETPKSTTEIYALFNRHVSNNKLQACLQELVGRGLVVKQEIRTAGRPRIVYGLAKKEN